MKSHNILIVDDEVENCFLIKEILKDEDRNFIYAHNGEDAVEICKSTHIDLIFMDLRMPKMNGFEATLKIKEYHPHIVVILQTAFAKELRKDDFIHVIVDDIVSKPIISRELKNKFEKYLAKFHHNCA